MKNQSQSVLVSVTRKLHRFARLGDGLGLREYLASDDFLAALAKVKPAYRGSIIDVGAKARADCAARSKVPKPGTRRAKWDAVMVAKFRNAYARTGSDERTAILCGISLSAAVNARKRLIDAPATVGQRLAA